MACRGNSQANRANQEVDELDADEGGYNPAGAIDNKITLQAAGSPNGPVGDPP
jgi:hypothetical protein